MTCKSCEFYNPIKDGVGICRFNPPVPVVRRMWNPHHDMYEEHEESIRPEVVDSDICGQYRYSN